MKLAITRCALLAALALLVTSAGTARAQISTQPILGYAGNIDAVPEGIGKSPASNSPLVLTTVYDNTTAAANFGLSSTDPLAKWGDEIFMTGTGLLSTHKFTIFNGSGAGLNLLTATVSVSFFDAVTSIMLGGYNTNINFGAGLPPNFYAIVTVTGIDPLLINLNTTDVIVLQTITAKTGTATALGIVSLDPPTIGTSPNTMFIQASTVNGGVPGFYSIGNPPVPANPGYQVGVNDLPVPVGKGTWGRIKQMYR